MNETFLVDGRRVDAAECARLFDAALPRRMERVLARAHGRRLLDVGCYDGSFLAAVRQQRPEIDAVATDYDPENLRIARQLHPDLHDRLVAASVYALPFPDASFDCVTLQEVIEHLEGAAQAVKELNRVLRQDGTLVITTPNAYHWRDITSHARFELMRRLRRRTAPLRSEIYFEESEWNRHIYTWTPGTLLTLLEVNGFSYVHHEYIHEEPSRFGRALMHTLPFLGPVTLLEVRKNRAAPTRLV